MGRLSDAHHNHGFAGGTGGAIRYRKVSPVFTLVPASDFATATHAVLRSFAVAMLGSVSFFSASVGRRPRAASVSASRIASSDFCAAINSSTSFSNLPDAGGGGTGTLNGLIAGVAGVPGTPGGTGTGVPGTSAPGVPGNGFTPWKK